MGIIKETNTIFGTVYERINDKEEIIKTHGIIGFQKDIDGNSYFILTDLNGKRIREANTYLNVKLFNASYKKREVAFSALKLLYSFIDIYGIDDYKRGLTFENITKLVYFLEGGKKEGNYWNLDFKTMRSNNTINNYLAVYRDYFKKTFQTINKDLYDSSTISVHSGGGFMGHAHKKAIERYKNNKKTKPNNNIPKFIKEDEYKKIIRLIEQKYTLREHVIIKLMYEYGCRLGEVLGITLEDLEEGIKGYYKIILRNRTTDKPWQSVKSVINIKSVEDYKRKQYQSEGNGMGYQYILVDDEMMELIEEYIEETRDELLLNKSDTKRRNLEIKSKADKVTNKNLMFGENQYLFLNQHHYTPLTASGWNYVLRQILKEVGIEIDKETKENNLSHRFRHGYAMNLVSKGFTQEELAELLRHSSTTTVKKYFNPDEEYKISLLEKQRKHATKSDRSHVVL